MNKWQKFHKSNYSRTSDNGPSEKRTTSLQRTHSLLRNEITIVIVLKQPPRNGRFSIPDSGQELHSQLWWPRAFRDSNSYFRRPISDFRSPFSDVRSPTSDLRSPISVIDILFGNYRTEFVTPVYIL